VPIDEIISVIKAKVDRRAYPKNQTIASWSEPWFLKAVSEQYARWVLAPRLVVKWQERIEAQHGDVSTPAASSERVEASPATQEPPALVDAPATPQPQSDATPDDGSEIDPTRPDSRSPDLGSGPLSHDPTEASLAKAPGEPTRNSVLAAFARNRPPPEPVGSFPPPALPGFIGRMTLSDSRRSRRLPRC
jgi:hypothetical protein